MMATNGEFMNTSQLSDKFGAGKMDGRSLVAHYNQAFVMEDEEVPMELPNGILEASEMSKMSENSDHDLYFELSITDTDDRFGFSVMGGIEEGFLPKVDEIVPGSPADRSDLQVGDEIIAVNGRSLADASHAEVIAHIHQCVKSKTINLRVKRRMGMSVESDPESRRIQEAYVIAVEQQTKDKIGLIANKNNVHTTDLINLPPLEQHPASALNGYVEPNVTVNNNNKDEISSYASSDSPSNVKHRKYSDTTEPLVNGTVREPSVRAVRLSRQKRVKIDGWLSNSESSTDDYRDFDLGTSRTVTANVEIPPHGIGEDLDLLPSKDIYAGEIVTEPQLESIELERIKAPPDLNELEQRLASGDNLGLNNNVDGVAREDPEMPREVPVDVPANLLVHSPNGMRNPREVAVDCPPGFVAASGMKNPPQQYHNSNNKHGNNHHVNGPSNGVANGPTTPTMVNGSDHALINSHKNSVDNRTRKNNKQNAAHMQQNDTRQKVPNDRRVPATVTVAPSSPGKVALPPEQNVSQNNSQGATVFEPASTRPLFDGGKASTSSSTSGEFTGNNKKTAVGLDELFSSLEHVQAKLGGAGDQTNVSFLQDLFRNSDFQHAVRVHKQVEDIHRRPDPPLPHAADAEQIASEIIHLTQDTRGREVDELRRILNQPSFRSLLNTHDRIASRDPGLMLPAEEDDDFENLVSDDGEDSVKIVRIDKTAEPLGATILNDGDAVIIGRIVKGGMAERSGLLHEGDEILEINGQEVKGKSVNQICDIMSTLTGTLTFLLIPSKENTRQPTREQSTMVHVRAHFDYDPEDDMYIPCRELGLSFHKGDILHVINQEDGNWWQAYREGEEDQSLAGLIPSRNFQQQREAMKQTMPDDEEPKKKLLCGGKRKKKKKKKLYANPNEQESDEILTYESVSLYTPVNKKKRPVVLIGPPKVGRHELRQRLLESDDSFAAAVPHTSRGKRDHETDGIDYHFVTKQKFEQDIVGGKFVEHGEFEKSIYGTSLDSIKAVVETGKICILNLHPQALKILKNSDLKPYFIFVCPPQLDRLRQQRTEAGELLKEEELREIIETGRAMEDAYGHFFDYVIIHYDHDRAYTELLSEINRIQTEPSWVPSSWLH